MSGWTIFLVVAAVILLGCLAAGAWMDHEARKRGSTLVTASEMGRAIKDAKREARGSRARLHIGGSSARGVPSPSARPRWDDRPR